MMVKEKQRNDGFTIVELLVVIVVIGILAAIVIVAYNSITSRANTSKAQTQASAVKRVAESMGVDNGYYPRLIADFTTGSTSTKLPGNVTVSATAPTSSNGTTTVQYHYCGDVAAPAAGQARGGRVAYYDYSAGGLAYIYVGAATATGGAGVAPCHTWVATS